MRILDRAARHDAFKTYRAIADFLELSEGYISRVRHGSKHLQPDQIRRLAVAIGEDPAATVLEELGLQQEAPEARQAFEKMARQLRGGGGKLAAISDGYEVSYTCRT